jgi:hypothetical protein
MWLTGLSVQLLEYAIMILNLKSSMLVLIQLLVDVLGSTPDMLRLLKSDRRVGSDPALARARAVAPS